MRTDSGDRWALNFYHYILTASEGGRVDLGDGGGGQRLAVEAAEDLLERGVEVLLHHGAYRFEGLGGHPVAQEPELTDQLGREYPLSR